MTRGIVVALAIASGMAVAPLGAGAANNVVGDGSNDHPYSATDCDSVTNGVCHIQFPDVPINGWETKYVPAYQCPANYKWLENHSYSPGRSVPLGFQVIDEETTGVGVTVTGNSTDLGKSQVANGKTYDFYYSTGTLTGFPNSSMTNYDVQTHGVIFGIYCTNSLDQASLIYINGPPTNRSLARQFLRYARDGDSNSPVRCQALARDGEPAWNSDVAEAFAFAVRGVSSWRTVNLTPSETCSG